MKKYCFYITSILIIFMLSCLKVNAVESSISRNDMLKKYGKLSFGELYKRNKAMMHANKPEMALNFCNLVISRSNQNISREDMRIYGCCLNDAGLINYFYKNNFIDAYSLYLKGMEIANKLGNDTLKANLYYNLGGIYTIMNDQKNSIIKFKKAFYYSRKTKEWNIFVTSFNMMMMTAFFQNSIKDYNDEISVFNKTKLPKGYVKRTIYISYKGILSYINKDYDASIVYFKSTVRDIQQLKADNRYLFSSLIMMAWVYYAKQDYSNALKIANQCKSLVIKDGTMPDMLSDVYDLYRKCYEKLGMKEKSKDYLIAYYQINDSLSNFNNFSILQNIENMNKIAEKDLLVQKERYKQNLQTNTIVMLIIILLVVTIMSLLLYKNNKTLQEANNVLYRKWNETQHIYENLETKIIEDEENNKYNTNPLSDDFKENLYKKIDDVLKHNEKVFSHDFTIEKLSELVDSNVRYVSQIINVYYEKNFSIVVGEIRVREACRRIVDIEHYGNLTLEAIAYDTGFKTRQNFNLIFKKVTGLSPSQYKKMSQEDKRKRL